MLVFLTILVMLLVAYAYLVEGLFTASLMFVNTFLAALLAFNFYEPLADQLESLDALGGYEDAICLISIFSLVLILLRTITNYFADTLMDFPEIVQRAGGAIFGLLTGYLICGFLLCVLETLPWDENFMGYEGKADPAADAIRRYFPPDRVMMALMHRAGASTFDNRDDHLYNRAGGTFELRYARFRRYSERDKRTTPRPYSGEFDPKKNLIP
jgi:hypothetical protein